MGQPDSKTGLLTTMARLIRERGYYATGISEVLKQSGLPSGSLYHHFPGGKEELAEAALNYSTDSITEDLKLHLKNVRSPTEALQKIGELLRRDLLESDFRHGCPVAPAALEASSEIPAIQKASSKAYTTWQNLSDEFLQKFGFPPKRAQALAVFLLSVLEGALLLCRAHQDVSYLDVCIDELCSLLKNTSEKPSTIY